MRIDIHSHFICLDFIKHLQRRDSLPVSSFEDGTYVTTCCPGVRIPAVPRFVDMEVKLRDMEEMKVDVSVLSHVQPGSEVLPSNEADYWASHINDHLAGIIEKYPRKFLGWGCLGFGSTERTIKEIDRCISELGFAGILLYSNIRAGSHLLWECQAATSGEVNNASEESSRCAQLRCRDFLPRY